MLTKEQKDSILARDNNTLKSNQKRKKLDKKIKSFFSNISMKILENNIEQLHDNMLRYYKINSKLESKYYDFKNFKKLIDKIHKSKNISTYKVKDNKDSAKKDTKTKEEVEGDYLKIITKIKKELTELEKIFLQKENNINNQSLD